MPKNTNIKSILVIGSGPIVIGQACEFDYSGTQALKALREEGYRVILINSNPATIMTDPEMADATYIEPITPETIEKIIQLEKPCAIIPTLGGQTSLNCALALYRNGVLKRYQVELIGASYDAITLAEDRSLFQAKMLEIGLEVPKSYCVRSKQDVAIALKNLGLPIVVRSSFTLGGEGAKIVHTEAEVFEAYEKALAYCAHQEITFDEALIGWKEFELEVIRDKNDNCIVVCGVENFDPLGIHTGDSITVAPIQTLTDKEYQKMRDAAFKVLRAVGVDTGGSNVQFALNPKTGKMIVIEMNPRVSRSSALVSKVTGFPIAKIAAKLAVGYTLDELKNEITNGVLPASFEPSIDYVVVKIPRFHDEKFTDQALARGPQMRSVGEVMALGTTFRESLQNAICSLEIGSFGFDLLHEKDDAELKYILINHSPMHLYAIAEALRRGFSIDEVHELSFVDHWFLHQIAKIIQIETEISVATQINNKAQLLHYKKNGFSDHRLATLLNTTEACVRDKRTELGVLPAYKHVDSCAGEFRTSTSYLYSTYKQNCEAKFSARKKIIIIGSGPNRIGQGIEFDYICVKAIQAFQKNGFETIMLNCNPETVSTDFDIADKLYFIPLTYEKVIDIIENEKPDAVALQFGGQTPLNLVDQLSHAGVPLIGLNADVIHLTEDREKFHGLLEKLGIKQPNSLFISEVKGLQAVSKTLEFPVIIRPSFVLGGKGMEVVQNFQDLDKKLQALFAISQHPILVEEFLNGAGEVDVDAVSDGEDIFIPLLLEHIEAVGVHSGDSACITPHYKLPKVIATMIHKKTLEIAKALNIVGLFNIQFAIKDFQIYVIEVNPRASRTTPFICKATGLPLIEIAINCMLGKSLREQKCLAPINLPYYFVKEAVLPFRKFAMFEPNLGPEMKATGEVMGIGRTPEEAFFKAQAAAGYPLPTGQFTVLVSGVDEKAEFLTLLKNLGCKILQINNKDKQVSDQMAMLSVNDPPQLIISLDSQHLAYAVHHHISYASTLAAAEIMVKSIVHQSTKDNVVTLKPLQMLYKEIKHPSKTQHILTGRELTQNDLKTILNIATSVKKQAEKYSEALTGKKLAMIFDKPSFRTRLSFSLAIESLSGNCVESIVSSRKTEEPKDIARVLNGYFDFVMVRTHDDANLEQMAEYSTIPIINGLSALHHPCQILADLLTLYENFGYLDGLTIAYVGDGNNILNSLMLLSPLVGVKIQYCCPPQNQPPQAIIDQCNPEWVEAFATPQEAVYAAHAVYTDVWTSMGFEDQINEANFASFQINEDLMSHAKPEALFMHCMPMQRNKEVSDTLADSQSSVIFEQSENRLHVQKALLIFLGL